jgi:hypothetical protein
MHPAQMRHQHARTDRGGRLARAVISV